MMTPALAGQVRKLAKQAAIEAREAALAAEEVQAMAAQLADRHGPSGGPAPSLTGHDRVGPLQALAWPAGAQLGEARHAGVCGCCSCMSRLPAVWPCCLSVRLGLCAKLKLLWGTPLSVPSRQDAHVLASESCVGPSMPCWLQVGDIHALVKRLSSASTLLPA